MHQRHKPSRRIRVFCDYSAEPVWGDYGLDDLPITPELRDRLRAWARLHETKDSFVLFREWDKGRAFIAEGRAIAREMKRQLPDWTIIYLDEAALEREWMRGKTLARLREVSRRRLGIVSHSARMRFWTRRDRRRQYRAHFEQEISGGGIEAGGRSGDGLTKRGT